MFIYLFLVALGLHCCSRAFSSCGEQGLLLVQVHGAPHCSGFSCQGAPVVGQVGFSSCSRRASVVVVRGLSRPEAGGILLDQGSNPCPLHWQVASHPLCCAESLSCVQLFVTPWTVAKFLCPRAFPGKNTGVGCHFLFLTQESNPRFLHCRQILYQLSYQGSPRIHCTTREVPIYIVK